MNGRFQSETEVLIIVIQDGVVHTNTYGHRILNDSRISILYRSCKNVPETIGHLLSVCKDLNWTLHKERHDRVLYQLLVPFCKRYDLELPDSMKCRSEGWNGMGIIESEKVKFAVDFSIPTNCSIVEHSPDLVVKFWESKCIVICEVACIWEPLLLE